MEIAANATNNSFFCWLLSSCRWLTIMQNGGTCCNPMGQLGNTKSAMDAIPKPFTSCSGEVIWSVKWYYSSNSYILNSFGEVNDKISVIKVNNMFFAWGFLLFWKNTYQLNIWLSIKHVLSCINFKILTFQTKNKQIHVDRWWKSAGSQGLINHKQYDMLILIIKVWETTSRNITGNKQTYLKIFLPANIRSQAQPTAGFPHKLKTQNACDHLSEQ